MKRPPRKCTCEPYWCARWTSHSIECQLPRARLVAPKSPLVVSAAQLEEEADAIANLTRRQIRDTPEALRPTLERLERHRTRFEKNDQEVDDLIVLLTGP